MNRILFLAVMVLLIGFPVWAQEEGSEKAEETMKEGAAQAKGAVETVKEQEEGKLLRAIRLPAAAEEARNEGVPSEDVKKVLEAAQSADLPAGETESIIVEETEAVKENGKVDDFGSFVRSKHDEGLRGRELSDAIHAEQAARGKGKGHGKGRKEGAMRAGEPDDGGTEARRGKQDWKDKNKYKAKQQGRMNGEKENLEEDVAEGEDAIRDKTKAEKNKGKQGMKKKTKGERPAEGDE